MKKIFFLIFFALVIIAKSQTVPQGINYQAVVRNNTGVVLISSTVNMKFELFNSASGPVIYTETHNGLSTGLVGVVTCSIGMGTTTNNFSVDVNWSNGDVWYQAYLDIGSGMNPVGAKQKFMTVPYSFYAKEVPVVSTGSVLTIGTKTVALNSGPTYTAGVGISIIGGIISNTTSAAVTPTLTGAGSTTVTGIYPTLTITSPTVQTYSAGSGISISGGVISNTAVVGGNGIYGGSGALTSSLTTVSIGTNTLSFSGSSNSAVADFMNNGTESFINIVHSGSNPASIKFKGLLASVPNYGSITGNSNGVSVNAGSYLNTITTSTLGDVWLNSTPSSSNEGRLVINHSSSQPYPAIHLKEISASLNRIKFSNNPIPNKYFEIGAQTNAVEKDGALSINYFDGVNYKSVLLINGSRQVFVNSLNYPLASFHVMENASTAGNGIISEGFGQPGKISIARNNPSGISRSFVNNADELGRLTFSGFNTTTLADGASIRAVATQPYAPGTNGTEMIFSTVPNGFSGLQDVMKLTNDGKVLVTNTLTIPFGGGLGKILTSDATGNASWQTATTGLIGAGTQSVIPMWGAGNTLTNSPISVNVSTGGVLVKPSSLGSGSPVSSLIVDGPSSGSTYVANFLYTNNANTGIGISTQPLGGHAIGTLNNQDLGFFTNNTNVTANYPLVLKTGGNVGIGTTSPTAKLNVYTNIALGEGIFSEAGSSSNTNAIRGITAGTGNAAFFGIYNPTSPGKAIEAQSNNQVATIGASNICTAPGDAIYASSINGRAIYASNGGTAGFSTIETVSNGSALALFASKNVIAGSVVSFQNSNTSNPFPVLDIYNSGQGPAIKLSTPATSTLALLIDEGHIRSTGTSVTTGTAAVSGGFASFLAPTILPNSNDVKGVFSFSVSGTSLVSGSFTEQEIRFSKAYSTIPVVVVSPLVDLQGLNFMISRISTSSFSVRVYQTSNPSVVFPTSILASSLFKFNYVVIE